MTHKSYEHYVDSGEQWLGSYPVHWHKKPLWTLFRRVKRQGFEDEELLSVYRDHGVIPKRSREDNFNKPSDDLGTYQLVEAGDLAVNKMKAWQGSVAISEHRGIVSPAYHVYAPLHSEHSRFFHYLMRCDRYVTGYLSVSKGIRVNQWDLQPEYHSRMPILVPPFEEQLAIATFLDRETAKIDALIAEQQRLIELLQEKRQAVISHAVTKGLNPNIPMKDSGVEWLGEVPEHWEIKAIKHLVSTPVTDGPHETPELVDDGVPFISAEAVSSGVLDFDKKRGFISREEHKRFSMKYIPAKHDIYMVKSGATTGVTAIVETDDEFNIWSPLAAIRCGSKISPYYLLAFMRSRNFQSAVMLGWNFGTQQNIGMKVIESLPVAVPPLDEQMHCLQHLEALLRPIEVQIELANSSTNLLSERRSALISAAVTGQIDVQHIAG